MAVAGLLIAFFSQHIDRRVGILLSLTALAVPTALPAVAPDLTSFTILRVVQGLFMSTAFTLMLSYSPRTAAWPTPRVRLPFGDAARRDRLRGSLYTLQKTQTDMFEAAARLQGELIALGSANQET